LISQVRHGPGSENFSINVTFPRISAIGTETVPKADIRGKVTVMEKYSLPGPCLTSEINQHPA
jgi:hypothetical protein